MSTNGKYATERVRDFQLPPFADPPKAQPLAKGGPLAKAEQVADQIAKQVVLIQQKQEMVLQQLMGKVAVLNSAKPIIEATFGDPNHNLQQLTRVILERGCDIAEDCIEIVIEDEN